MGNEKQAAKKVDLLPQEYTTRQKVKSRLLMFAVLGVAACGVVLAMAVAFNFRIQKLEEIIAPLRADVESNQSAKDRLAPLLLELEMAFTSENRALETQIEIAAVLDEPFWSALLAELGAAEREQVWITELTLSKSTGENSSLKREIALKGEAASYQQAMAFIQRMENSPHLEYFKHQASRSTNSGRHRDAEVIFEAQGVVQ